MKLSIVILLLSNQILILNGLKFPKQFKFGVGTSSYQIEGAWNLNDKGENIWDRITHANANFVTDNSNADIACDSYHKTDEDIRLLKTLGVNFYRFSISWSRILPNGFSNYINQDGIDYYNNLIDNLLRNGIQPFVTIFHWDLPQPLQDLGGWANSDLDLIFLDYAKILFSVFGDRVKYWITVNEPETLCRGSYEADGFKLAPGIRSKGIGIYLCGHTILKAHAKIYRYYENVFKAKQNGKVGITLQTNWFEPENTENYEDVEIANTRIQFELGWFAHPIFSSEGDYPEVMKKNIDENSAKEKFPRSRLPKFTESEISELRNSADFLGFNHYTTEICTKALSNFVPSRMNDIGAYCYQLSNWEPSGCLWVKAVPWGFRKVLNWIKTEYNNPEVIITENGFCDGGEIQDCRRVYYHNSYLEELLKAIHQDDCYITGYTAWSFMDNFEWAKGYTEKFGLIQVNFDDPNRTRIPKMSMSVYAKIIKTGEVNWHYQPEGFEQCNSST